MTLSRWQLDSHDVLLCSHNEEPPPAHRTVFEPGKARAAPPAAPLKGSPAWHLQDTVLKMSDQAICSERKITTAITALDFLGSRGAQAK